METCLYDIKSCSTASWFYWSSEKWRHVCMALNLVVQQAGFTGVLRSGDMFVWH